MASRYHRPSQIRNDGSQKMSFRQTRDNTSKKSRPRESKAITTKDPLENFIARVPKSPANRNPRPKSFFASDRHESTFNAVAETIPTNRASPLSSRGSKIPLLFQLIEAHDWSRAIRYLHQHPEEAGLNIVISSSQNGRPKERTTALHEACKRQPPVNLVSTLVDLNEKACKVPGVGGGLPLHGACATGASADVVGCLLENYPSATRTKDAQGRLPLHWNILYAIDEDTPDEDINNGDYVDSITEVTLVLLMVHPKAAATRDGQGQTPIECVQSVHHADQLGQFQYHDQRIQALNFMASQLMALLRKAPILIAVSKAAKAKLSFESDEKLREVVQLYQERMSTVQQNYEDDKTHAISLEVKLRKSLGETETHNRALVEKIEELSVALEEGQNELKEKEKVLKQIQGLMGQQGGSPETTDKKKTGNSQTKSTRRYPSPFLTRSESEIAHEQSSQPRIQVSSTKQRRSTTPTQTRIEVSEIHDQEDVYPEITRRHSTTPTRPRHNTTPTRWRANDLLASRRQSGTPTSRQSRDGATEHVSILRESPSRQLQEKKAVVSPYKQFVEVEYEEDQEDEEREVESTPRGDFASDGHAVREEETSRRQESDYEVNHDQEKVRKEQASLAKKAMKEWVTLSQPMFQGPTLQREYTRPSPIQTNTNEEYLPTDRSPTLSPRKGSPSPRSAAVATVKQWFSSESDEASHNTGSTKQKQYQIYSQSLLDRSKRGGMRASAVLATRAAAEQSRTESTHIRVQQRQRLKKKQHQHTQTPSVATPSTTPSTSFSTSSRFSHSPRQVGRTAMSRKQHSGMRASNRHTLGMKNTRLVSPYHSEQDYTLGEDYFDEEDEDPSIISKAEWE